MTGSHRFRPSQRGATTNLLETLHRHAQTVEAQGQRVIYLHIGQPGTDFSPRHGHHFVRFSYGGATDDIEEAVARIERWRHGR